MQISCISSKQIGELRRYFSSRREVVAAYLFGSVAEGVARADSDVDIALLIEESFLPESFLEYRARVSEDVGTFLHREVEVVVLNQASPLFSFQVIKKGRLLYDERDSEQRAIYQMRLMNRYYDYKRYFDYHAEHLKRRIKEVGLGAG